MEEAEVIDLEHLSERQLSPARLVESDLPSEDGKSIGDHSLDRRLGEELLHGRSPQPAQSLNYTPSIRTDFSEPFEVIYTDVRTPISANYDPDRLVSSAWHSLGQDEPKQVWETGFWNLFFDKNKSVLDIHSRGFKRPIPFEQPLIVSDAVEEVVEERKVSRPSFDGPEFLKHVKDIPEKTWMEERDAQWETAIRRCPLLIHGVLIRVNWLTLYNLVLRLQRRRRCWWMCSSTERHRH